jgi:hypothetical protein
LLAEQREIEVHTSRQRVEGSAVQGVYPFSEIAREDSTFLIDLMVQIVDLNEDAKKDVDFGDDLFGFLFSGL